jgi:hypothetical protein
MLVISHHTGQFAVYGGEIRVFFQGFQALADGSKHLSRVALAGPHGGLKHGPKYLHEDLGEGRTVSLRHN